MVRMPPKAPYITREGEGRPTTNKYRGRTFVPGIEQPTFYPRTDEYGRTYPPYTGPLGTHTPGSVFDPRSRTPTTQNASFSNSFASGMGTAYQQYVAKYYGPDVTSHNDPIALARAATGAVAEGLKTGAGWLGHAAAGLLGAPQGPSTPTPGRASSSQDVVYGGRGGGGAAGRMPSGNISSPGAGLSSPGPADADAERFFNAISEAEGTTKYGYNTVYGGANGIGGRPLTSMTLRELTDYQKGMIPRQGASPMGKFQINRGTVLHHATKLGLDLDKTVFDQTTQKKLALSIAGEQGIKPPVWDGFKDKPKLLATALQAYSQIKGKPVSVLAYTSTDPNLTPAQQAAAAQAAGTSGSTSNVTDRGEHIAAMQRDLNSRGAKLTVDGLEGPLTRQAEQQFYGSPSSVRTPSTTNRPTYTSDQQDQGTVPRTGVASTPSTNQPYSPAAATPRTPYYNNPYTNSTGGASYTSGRGDEGRGVPAQPSMGIPRQVQAVDISGSPMPLRPFQPAETARIPRARPDIPGQNAYTSGRGDQGVVPRTGVASTPYLNQPYTGPEWDVIPGPVQVPVPQTPTFMNPYTMGTGGANAIQTARLPRARPDYQPPQQAVPTLIERLDNLVERAERALGGNKDSRGSNSGSSRSGGGNYSGGNYGGQGGSRISEGVGGAYKNR